MIENEREPEANEVAAEDSKKPLGRADKNKRYGYAKAAISTGGGMANSAAKNVTKDQLQKKRKSY